MNTRLKAFLSALALALLASPAFAAEDRVVLFADDDPEMNAAIERARASLVEFWKHLVVSPSNETDFSLKLAISDGTMTEHFWCGDIQGGSLGATCAIANEPQDVMTVAFGQRVSVEADRISDWMYKLDGKIKGAETLRVIVTRLPAGEAEPLRAMLADN